MDPLERVRHALLQARCGGAFLLRRDNEEIRLDLRWASYEQDITAALAGLTVRRTDYGWVVTVPPLASDPQPSDNTR